MPRITLDKPIYTENAGSERKVTWKDTQDTAKKPAGVRGIALKVTWDSIPVPVRDSRPVRKSRSLSSQLKNWCSTEFIRRQVQLSHRGCLYCRRCNAEHRTQLSGMNENEDENEPLLKL